MTEIDKTADKFKFAREQFLTDPGESAAKLLFAAMPDVEVNVRGARMLCKLPTREMAQAAMQFLFDRSAELRASAEQRGVRFDGMECMMRLARIYPSVAEMVMRPGLAGGYAEVEEVVGDAA